MMPNPYNQYEYDADRLRDAAGVEEQKDPTHKCMSCRDEVAHIESSPTKEYRWCPTCEEVTRWKRLDRKH
jgi:ribosomal protein L37AE/L43A